MLRVQAIVQQQEHLSQQLLQVQSALQDSASQSNSQKPGSLGALTSPSGPRSEAAWQMWSLPSLTTGLALGAAAAFFFARMRTVPPN